MRHTALILTDFNYATLTSLYIFQKTVDCKQLTSLAKTLVLTAQPSLMTLLLRLDLGH